MLRRTARGGSLKPEEWTSLRVCDGEDEDSVWMDLERNRVRESLDQSASNRSAACLRSTRPDGIRVRFVDDPLQAIRDLQDELVAKSTATPVVPQRGAAKLVQGVRMKFNRHDAA